MIRDELASVLMCVAAIVLFAMSFLADDAAEVISREIVCQDPLPTNELAELRQIGAWDSAQQPLFESAGSADIWAMFILHAKVCPTCLNEVVDFLALLDQMPLETAVVDSALVLLEQNHDAALRFMQSTALPVRAAQVTSSELAQELSRFEPLGEGGIQQQLVFVDVARQEIFFRSLLSTYPTELSYKTEVLNKMLAAFDEPL